MSSYQFIKVDDITHKEAEAIRRWRKDEKLALGQISDLFVTEFHKDDPEWKGFEGNQVLGLELCKEAGIRFKEDGEQW